MSFSQRALAVGLAAAASMGTLCGPRQVLGAEPDAPDADAPNVAPGIELRYEAPTGCGSRGEVLERVRHLTEGGPGGGVNATVVVRRIDGGYDLEYGAAHDGNTSQRKLTVVDCAAVVEASALLLALTLEPVDQPSLSGTEPPQVEPSEQASERSAAASLEPDAARVSQTPEIDAREASLVHPTRTAFDHRGWFGITGEAVAGLTPRLATGVRGETGATLGPFQVSGSLSYDWVASEPLTQLPTAAVHSTLWRGQVGAGPTIAVGAVELTPALGVGVNYMQARLDGISNPLPGGTFWWSAHVAGELRWKFSDGFAVKLQAGAVWNLQRPKFTVVGIPGLVHQPQALGAQANAGLLWLWGSR